MNLSKVPRSLLISALVSLPVLYVSAQQLSSQLLNTVLDLSTQRLIWQSPNTNDLQQMGITRYEINGNPLSDSVLVVRQTQSTNGKTDCAYESVSYSGGRKTSFDVMVADPSLFPFTTPEVKAKGIMVKSTMTAWAGDGSSTKSWGTWGPNLELAFNKSNGDVVKITFVAAIKTYAQVKQYILGLPSIANPSISWTTGAAISSDTK